MNGLTATSFFHGAGGDSLGLTQAGFQLDAASNHWPVCVKTHMLNHPDTKHFTANLSDTSYYQFPTTDILRASPSCTKHARAGGRKALSIDTERQRSDAGAVDRATAFAIVGAAEVHQYQAVIVENVPEFQRWVLYPEWLSMMAKLGYVAQETVMNSAAFGVAQNRHRIYIVFTRGGNVDLTPPNLTPTPAAAILDPNLGKLVTRKLYVDDQIEQITDYDRPHLVTYRKHAKALPADLHPLATITAGGNHHGIATRTKEGVRFRMLNNRECARGQVFPDTYLWHGKADEVKKQIGNAVSVPVAKFLGERIASHLLNRAAA